ALHERLGAARCGQRASPAITATGAALQSAAGDTAAGFDLAGVVALEAQAVFDRLSAFRAQLLAEGSPVIRRRSAQLCSELLAQRKRRSETYLRCDAVDRHVSSFQELLCPRYTFGVEPFDEGRARGFAKATGEGATAHAGHIGQRVERQGFGQMFPRPLQHAGQTAFARQLRDRLFDVLRLPALPVRWR